MYRIALCDNKISFAGEVESKLLELSCRKGISVQVEVFLNGEDLISEMGTSYFDAIYLRMEMQGENGIQIASRISEYSGRFYTPIPEIGNRRSDVKETALPF